VSEIEWSGQARADLLSIVGGMARADPGAAQLFKNDIEARVADIESRGRPEGPQQLAIRAGFAVVYENLVFSTLVLRVLHTARRWPPCDPKV
jgi:plasmid stabilization system protein ParE